MADKTRKLPIRGPFAKFACGECGRWIERQISARNTARELSDLCDGPQLYCAGCTTAAHRSNKVLR